MALQCCAAVISNYNAYICFDDAVVEFYQQLGFEAEPEGIRYGVVNDATLYCNPPVQHRAWHGMQGHVLVPTSMIVRAGKNAARMHIISQLLLAFL